MLGSFGDIAIFSFQYNENITSGEGGMVVTDSADLHQRIYAFHCHGYVGRPDGQMVPDASPVQTWGIGVPMSDMTAALLLGQCHRLDGICAKMRERARKMILSNCCCGSVFCLICVCSAAVGGPQQHSRLPCAPSD